MAAGEFSASRFLAGSNADEYVKEIGLPGTAKYGLGTATVNSIIEATTAPARAQFSQARQGSKMNTRGRLGETTETGQSVKAMNAANAQIAGVRAKAILGGERENEQFRAQAEGQYLQHLTFMDQLRLDAETSEEEFALQRDANKFGWEDALYLAAAFV